MKKTLFTLFFAALSVAMFAQTTAQDFTKIDCAGVSHNLFSELDQNKVVFIEFAMMPTCQTCIDAGKKIEKLKKSINAAYPGKVNWYLMEWSGAKTCADMQAWAKTNTVTSTILPKGNTEVDYYGGMGMPTIAVLGGKDHKVLWKKVGFTTSDTTKIKTAMNSFFASVGTNDAIQSVGMTIAPNPANNAITLNLEENNAQIQAIEIFNLLGERVLSQNWTAEQSQIFDISTLVTGTYLVQLLDKNNSQVAAKRFVKE
jgi:hypothetical protein